jgi:hypothetical protein
MVMTMTSIEDMENGLPMMTNREASTRKDVAVVALVGAAMMDDSNKRCFSCWLGKYHSDSTKMLLLVPQPMRTWPLEEATK